MRFLALLLSVAAFGQTQRLFYPAPPAGAIDELRGTTYSTAGGAKLEFDLYRPTGGQAAPFVIFLNGFGVRDFRQWLGYQDWARVVTSRGIAGITMDSRSGHVPEDFRALLDYIRTHAAELHLIPDQAMLWCGSAHVLVGLPIAMDPANRELRAAVINYGIGEVKEIRRDLPVLYLRAGTDDADQNRAIDALIGRALAANAPWSMVNLGSANHAFDVQDDNEWTRAVVAQTLDFMKAHTRNAVHDTIAEGAALAGAVSAAYRQDWPAAVAAYQAVADRNPTSRAIHFRYAETLFRAGEYARAEKEFRATLALGHHNVGMISYYAAAASIRINKPEAAMEWIERLKDLDWARRRVTNDPSFAPLSSNARFQEIMGSRK